MDPEQNLVGNGDIGVGEQNILPTIAPHAVPQQYPLPVGLFYAEPTLNKVNINAHLADLLGFSEDNVSTQSYQIFIQRLFNKTNHPGFNQANFNIGFLNNIDHPSLIVTFKDFPDRSYKLFIYDDPSVTDTNSFGGLFVDLSADQRIIKQQMKILVALCQQSRKISAAAGGNLQALVGNFQTWNDKLVKEFLLDTQDQIQSLNSRLDLVLNFINILYERALYPETINFWELLHETIQEYPDLDLYYQDSISPEKPFIPVHLDPVITNLALRYLLDEISNHIQPEHPVDVVITHDDERVKVNLQSSRTLPLPGFSTGLEENPQDTISPTVILAKNIIASQGGEVHLHRHSAEQGTGISVNIALPLYKGFEPSEKINLRLTENFNHPGGSRVLLVESQPEYQLSIQNALSKEGYRVDHAIEGNTALDMVQRINPAAVITARNLPGLDGILLTQGIRRWSAVPIIMISTSRKPDDLVQAFQVGVDDYLIKPFLIEELILRLRSIIKRSEASQVVIPDIYNSGDIRIDFSSGQVWRKGNPVRLTPIEYNLLVYMARQGKQIMTYDQLLDRVWEGPDKGSRQGLFVHVRRLREKIETDPKKPKIIRNKWGVGYEFSP